MLKKAILVVAVLIFAGGILIASVLRTSAQTPSAENSPQISPSPQEVEKVDYFLPYPGILPGHFLYPIKMIRDKILLFLTTEPLKRGERLLHYADKRIEAARLLAENGRQSLAVTTATKAEKYLERAINQEKEARAKGKKTHPFLVELSKASLKHQQVLLEIKGKTSSVEQSVIDSLLHYPQEGYQKVQQLL